MKDLIIKETGNSRNLRTSMPTGTTWAQALAEMRNGTFPIDLNGYNDDGIRQEGTPLNTANLLSDAVAELLGGDSGMTPSQAFERLLQLCALKPVSVTATLAAASWTQSGTKWVQTVSASGVTASGTVIVSYAPESHDLWTNCEIYATGQGAGTLTFTAIAKPTAAVKANIVILG